MPVGPPATEPHIKCSDGRYALGCQTNFEIGAFRHRYCCALSRAVPVFLGEPPARLRQVHPAVLDRFQAAFETMRPGVACGDIERAFRRTFNPRGASKESESATPSELTGPTGGSLQDGDEI